MNKGESSYKNLYQLRPTSSRSRLPSSNSNAKLPPAAYLSNKENDSKLTNRLQVKTSYESHQPRLRREFKLYTELEEEDKSKLLLKIQRMEEFLQRKISEEGFLSFFKTNNSSINMSHIDIYLQMIKFEEANVEKGKYIKELEHKLNDSNKETERLLVIKEENQRTMLQHLKEIKLFNQVVDKYKVASEEARDFKQKYGEVKGLFEEVQKQRLHSLKRIKELEDVDSRERLQSLNDEIEKYSLRCEELSEENKELSSENKELSSENKLLRDRAEQGSVLADELRVMRLKSQEANELRDNHKQLLSKCQEQDARVEEQESKLKEQDVRIKQQLSDNQHLTAQSLALQENKLSLEEKCSGLQGRCTKLDMDIREKEETLKMKTRALEDARKSMENMEIQRDYERCMRSKCEDEISLLKSNAVKVTASVEVYESCKKTKVIEVEQLTRQRNLLKSDTAALKQELLLLSATNQNLKAEVVAANSHLRQFSFNEKKWGTERYRIYLRLQENLNHLRTLASTSSSRSFAGEEQIEEILCELLSTAACIKQRICGLESALKEAETQKTCSSQNAALNVEMMEESIRLLLRFVPGKSEGIVQEYLMVTEETLYNNTKANLAKRAVLIDQVVKETENSRKAEQELEAIAKKLKELEDFKRTKEMEDIDKLKQVEDMKRERDDQMKKERDEQMKKEKEEESRIMRQSSRLSLQTLRQKESRTKGRSSNKDLIKKYFD